MKTLLFALSLICLALAYDTSLPPVVLFNQYVINENLKFSSDAEAKIRFETFQSNLKLIKDLNSKQLSAKFGITKFAHYSPEEFKSIFLTLNTPVRDQDVPVAPAVPQEEVDAIPDSWDWVAKGAVTAVKDQGQCGSCWTFSTTGNIEGQWFLAGHSLVSLSEQNIVDCDHLCANGSCDSGCNGGLMGTAFDYVMQQGGIDSESSYPYTAEDGKSCLFNKANVAAKISGWNFVNADEGQMAAALVAKGPISVAVDATSWQFYLGGVLQSPIPCGTTLDHGVLVVGYGTETNIIGETVAFWKIKNSWGSSWGESGYIRIERGTGYCGVNLYPCSSFV